MLSSISSLSPNSSVYVVRLPSRVDPVPRVGQDKIDNPLPLPGQKQDTADISPEARKLLLREQRAQSQVGFQKPCT